MVTHTGRRTVLGSTRLMTAALVMALPVAGAVVPNASASSADVAQVVTGDQAVISEPFPNQEAASADGYVPADEAGWRQWIYKDGGDRYGRLEELKVHSPSMNRDIPVVTIRANVDPDNAPTVYLLNGADGGTGRANWLQQTSAIEFYGNEIGGYEDRQVVDPATGETSVQRVGTSNVNVVIPMSGAFSYYTDWEEPSVFDKDGNGNGGVQKWETFLTAELPGAMEQGHLKTRNPKRAIIGMSMSGSSVLVYAQQHPGFYDAVASYSGCPATSGGPVNSVDVVFRAKGEQATYEQMWGNRDGEVAHRNDAQLNADKLRDQHNVYISSGTGLFGEHDVPSGDRLRGNPVGSIIPAFEGAPIEAATNACTHMFKAATDKVGITQESNNFVYNFRNTGTHQWGYWQDDMFASWPVIARGLGLDVADASIKRDRAAADYLANHQGVGGS